MEKFSLPYMSGDIHKIVERIEKKYSRLEEGSLQNPDVFARQIEREKDQIEEMCARVDEEYALLTELRASGLSPEDWIKKKGDEILENCTPEEREEILRIVKEEGVIEVEEQADALDEETDEIQIEQEESKEE